MMNIDERIAGLLGKSVKDMPADMIMSLPLEPATTLIKALIREVVAEITPARLHPRMVDAGNEAYQRITETPAENFRHGFTIGQERALNALEAKAKELLG